MRDLRGGVSALLWLSLTACGAPPGNTSDGAPAQPQPVVSVNVALEAQSTISVPKNAAQVELRLAGDFGDSAELVAELDRIPETDSPRRWPVSPGEGGTERGVSVTVPAYALSDGDFSLTLWRGDAEVVRRVRFRVAHSAP